MMKSSEENRGDTWRIQRRRDQAGVCLSAQERTTLILQLKDEALPKTRRCRRPKCPRFIKMA